MEQPTLTPSRREEHWMSRVEACAHLGVSVRGLRRMCKRGQLERRVEEERALYRVSPPSPDLQRSPNTPPRTQPDTSAPLRRSSPRETHTEKDFQRLSSLLKQAIDQRNQANDAHQQVLAKQEKILQRLDAILEERDQIAEERNLLAQRHQEALNHLGEAVGHLRTATRQRDKAMEQRDRALEQRDNVIEKLETALEERKHLHRKLSTAHHHLQNWQAWQQSAQATLACADARTARALTIAVATLRTPWWAFQRREALQNALLELLETTERKDLP